MDNQKIRRTILTILDKFVEAQVTQCCNQTALDELKKSGDFWFWGVWQKWEAGQDSPTSIQPSLVAVKDLRNLVVS